MKTVVVSFLATAAVLNCLCVNLAIADEPLHLSCDYSFESRWLSDPQIKGKLLQPADAQTHHIFINIHDKTAKFDNNPESYEVVFDDNTFQIDDLVPLHNSPEDTQILIDRRSGFLSILKSTDDKGQIVVTNEIYGICPPQVQRLK